MRQQLKGRLGALLFAGATVFSPHAADVLSPGFLKFEYFGGINGTAVSALTSDPRYTSNTPDAVYWMPGFDTRAVLPADDHENYGARISGFLVPEQTGDYDFFISSDDASELWLSTSESTANLTKIAEETGCCNAFQEPGAAQTTAAPIHLVAGQKYAIQALLKEGGGGDYVRVAWRKTDDSTPAASLLPIPARDLAANVPGTGTISIAAQPSNASVPAGAPGIFSVGYNATFPAQIGTVVGNVKTNAVAIQWYRNGVAIPGATSASYAVAHVDATADANAKFSAKLWVPGSTTAVTTSEATLAIAATPPNPTPGFLMFEYFGNIGTTPVTALTDDPRYQANTPDGILWMTSFDSRTVFPGDDHENYGARITGFIVPTETADYDFFIRSDDASELWLSTDATQANLSKIAEETGCCNAFLEPGAAQTTAAPIHLVAGQRYAVQALLKEGGGGDVVQVAWRKVGDTTAAAALTPIPGRFLAAYTFTGGNVTITQQPVSTTVAENAPATFNLNYTSTQPAPIGNTGGTFVGAPVSIQWFENGVAIPGATGTNLTIALAKVSENNAKISARVSTPGASATTAEATLSVTADTVAPTLVSATANGTFTNIILTFSEPITATTATALANYSVDGGLTISGVTQVNPTTVRLTTGTQTPGTVYNVTINNLRDTAAGGGNLIAANTKGAAHAWVLSTGALRVDRYFNIGGTAVDTLTADPRFPNNPDDTVYWTTFGPFAAGNPYGDNYGARIYGWIVPQKSGQYKFFLRSDDSSRLLLSTDENPANASVIAEQTGCCNAFTDTEGTLSSTPIDLVANKRYYIEALLKEGGGDDYLQVAWNTPDSASLNNVAGLAPIPGRFLQTFVDPVASITITNQPTNITAVANSPVSFTVGFIATNSVLGNSASIQWQRAAAGSSTFTDIPGATSATFSVPFADPADNGAQYRANISVLSLTNVTSSVATLSLTADTTVPTVTSVSGSLQGVSIAFSEPLDPATAGNKANYTVDKGAVVNSASVVTGAGGVSVVQLAVSGIQAGTTYNLTVNGVKDRSGNTVASTTRSFSAYTAFYDFAAGTPTGTTLYGSATITSGGVLELTPAAGSMQGGFMVPDLANGNTITNIIITTKLFIGQGSGNPADGFSISYGTDIPDGSAGEEGAGSGLVIAFDTYDNGGGEAPAITVRYGGTDVGVTNLAKATLVNDRWVDLLVRVNADGTVDVTHDGVPYFSGLQVGITPMAGGRILFGARTGGEFEAARLDDLGIIVNGNAPIAPQVGTFSATTLNGRNATISWAGAGVLQQATAVTGPYTDVTGVTGSSYTFDTSTAPARFFRLRN